MSLFLTALLSITSPASAASGEDACADERRAMEDAWEDVVDTQQDGASKRIPLVTLMATSPRGVTVGSLSTAGGVSYLGDPVGYADALILAATRLGRLPPYAWTPEWQAYWAAYDAYIDCIGDDAPIVPPEAPEPPTEPGDAPGTDDLTECYICTEVSEVIIGQTMIQNDAGEYEVVAVAAPACDEVMEVFGLDRDEDGWCDL